MGAGSGLHAARRSVHRDVIVGLVNFYATAKHSLHGTSPCDGHRSNSSIINHSDTLLKSFRLAALRQVMLSDQDGACPRLSHFVDSAPAVVVDELVALFRVLWKSSMWSETLDGLLGKELDLLLSGKMEAKADGQERPHLELGSPMLLLALEMFGVHAVSCRPGVKAFFRPAKTDIERPW